MAALTVFSLCLFLIGCLAQDLDASPPLSVSGIKLRTTSVFFFFFLAVQTGSLCSNKALVSVL